MNTFRINAVGPALVSQVYLPLIEKSNRKVILHVSSTAGSIGSIDLIGATGKYPTYAMSKAALNMLVSLLLCSLVCRLNLQLVYSQAVKQKGFRPDLITITLCPGHVKTGMVEAAFYDGLIANALSRTSIDMGGPNGALEPEESVAGILKVVTVAT